MSVAPLASVSRVKRAESGAAGRVMLVGAGPGDPDLLTVKALQAIQAADIILYDRLVSEDIRQLFPTSTPALYVGKAHSDHSIPQAELNQLLIKKAQAGLNVCRLKGGDAFVFGRGGEEMLELKKAGIEVQVVPGITAASGCTTYAGIPLTHRGVAQGCTLVTGHGEKDLNINWKSLAQLHHTLVFYMGLANATLIQSQLMQHGLCGTTPVALIENGCCQEQRVVKGQLQHLAQLAMNEKVQSPALIVIGDVVALADQLSWFEALQQTEPTSTKTTLDAAFRAANLNRLSA